MGNRGDAMSGAGVSKQPRQAHSELKVGYAKDAVGLAIGVGTSKRDMNPSLLCFRLLRWLACL